MGGRVPHGADRRIRVASAQVPGAQAASDDPPHLPLLPSRDAHRSCRSVTRTDSVERGRLEAQSPFFVKLVDVFVRFLNRQ